jgi:C4-dicarboxylate-specific signal transduction histidine kinase
VTVLASAPDKRGEPAASPDVAALEAENQRLRDRIALLEAGVQKGEERRRALLHILSDYEHDRRRLARQTERLDNSRRALLHILQDAHRTNIKLADSRKAMIHIMGDLRDTTAEIQQREQELRDKQEQLVQAGKLATLGELTTGVAHELNNPLNNIGLYLGNVADRVELGEADPGLILEDLTRALRQVQKASEIIAHLRTFGRVALVSRERVVVNEVIERALSLMAEQLRLREIRVELALASDGSATLGNAIQLEQVFINLLSNARDALGSVTDRRISVVSFREGTRVVAVVADSGPGIAPGLEQRIFDPFFTTKEVGQGTGLGLSITYGIIQEHGGEIGVSNVPGGGARFTVSLPLSELGDEAAAI